MVRVRSVVPVLLMALVIPAFVFAAEKSTKPPANLHRVGDHYTPYNPPDPATFPPGSKTYIIERGDTLWALASKFYGNAYLWPQLWEANTYITDAHWIYPGDPLLVQGETTTGEVPSSTTVETAEEVPGGETGLLAESTMTNPPVPLGTEADVFCWGYLGDPDEPLPNRIYGFDDSETKYIKGVVSQDTGVAVGEVIFIEGGESTGLVPGDTYLVVEPGPIIHNPGNGEVVGRHYDFRGQVRILCLNTGNVATGIVTQACNDIQVGDRLKPLPQLPIPIARLEPMADVCTPSSGKTSGYIVYAKDYEINLGEGSLVEINLGREDFVEPGDFLTVYQHNPMPGTPRQVLGEVAVLTAEAHTATGRIVKMRRNMNVGDHVELK